MLIDELDSPIAVPIGEELFHFSIFTLDPGLAVVPAGRESDDGAVISQSEAGFGGIGFVQIPRSDKTADVVGLFEPGGKSIGGFGQGHSIRGNVVGMGILTGQNTSLAGGVLRRRCIAAGEMHAIGGQCVQVRGFDDFVALKAGHIERLAVSSDQDEVRFIGSEYMWADHAGDDADRAESADQNFSIF